MNHVKSRILGIAIRARWLGYAVLDGHLHLIDWGMIYYQQSGSTTLKAARRRAESMIAQADPSQLVLLSTESDAYQRRPSVQSITRAIRTLATQLSIRTDLLTRTDLRGAFGELPSQSKDAIASEVARRFPELAWKLPPKRKTWKKEDSRLALFDALAAALAHAQINGNEV